MAAFAQRMGTRLMNLYLRPKAYMSKKWPIVKKYAVVELRPPNGQDFTNAVSEAKTLVAKAKDGAWKDLTVYKATVNSFVAIEVAMWFFAGECIGKRSYIGYPVKVDGAVFTFISFQYD